MSDKIYFRRGNRADIPVLGSGEPGLATDTKGVFVGSPTGNIELLSVLNGGSKIQMGTASVTTGAAPGNYGVNISFPVTFSSMPEIFVSGKSNNAPNIVGAPVAGNATAGGFTAYLEQKDSVTRTMEIYWIAFGT